MALTPTALKAVRRLMIRREPKQLGNVETITALAAQTVTVAQLATGNQSAQLYQNRNMVRADGDSTSVDRVRNVSGFVSATGVFTHTGTAYTDTTLGTEEVELLKVDPRDLDAAINERLGTFKHLDITTMPGVSNKGRQWLQDFDWIENPGDIYKIAKNGSPRLSRNHYFENWPTYSSGALQPAFWVLAGSGASIARSTTLFDTSSLREGRKNQLSMTRAGTDCTLTQVTGLLFGGIDASSLQGETVVAWGRGLSGTASSLRMFIDDGVTTTNGDFHSGGGGIEEISVTMTLSASATKLDFGFEQKEDETVELSRGELLFSGSVEDSHRIDNYGEEDLWSRGASQADTDLPVDLPTIGRGQSYLFYSSRPYPRFTQSRITAGTADDDVTDAPADILYLGALATFFRNLSSAQNENTLKYQQLSAKYEQEYQTAARDHMNIPQASELPLSRRRALAGAPRR